MQKQISHHGYVGEWRNADEVDAHTGDKLDFDRGPLYNHVGIADGKGGVYHYAPGNDTGSSLTAKKKAKYRHDKIKDVAKGKKVRVNNSEDKIKDPKPPKEIIKRAKKKVGTGEGKYNVVNNNCEHNATDARYEEPMSEQVSWWENIGAAIAATATAVLALGAIIVEGRSRRGRNKRN